MSQILRFTITEEDEKLPERLAHSIVARGTLPLPLIPALGGKPQTVTIRPTGVFRSTKTDNLEVTAEITESDKYPIGTIVNITFASIGDIVMSTVKLLTRNEA